jgi:hypothetical protein
MGVDSKKIPRYRGELFIISKHTIGELYVDHKEERSPHMGA